MFKKPPVVDYRQCRLSKLNEPEFSHLKLLGGWIFYFLMYFITENLIPASSCHPIHCVLDDMIPFNELFVIPYVFWYVLVGGSLLYYALYNIEGFKRLQWFIILTQVIAMTIYVLYPSRQDLRPETFQHHKGKQNLAPSGQLPVLQGHREDAHGIGHMQRGTDPGVGVKGIDESHQRGQDVLAREDLGPQILTAGPDDVAEHGNGLGDHDEGLQFFERRHIIEEGVGQRTEAEQIPAHIEEHEELIEGDQIVKRTVDRGAARGGDQILREEVQSKIGDPAAQQLCVGKARVV